MTDVQKVRYLITGDPDSSLFTDEQIQLFLDQEASSSGIDQIRLAAADGLDLLGAKSAQSSSTSLRLGDYAEGSKDQSKSFQDQAERMRDLVYNTPAFAIAEQNLSSFNALEIIRNFILRNEI